MSGPLIKLLSEQELVNRLRRLQREFDAGEWNAGSILDLIAEHKQVWNELRSRGLSEEQIEWRLCDQALA